MTRGDDTRHHRHTVDMVKASYLVCTNRTWCVDCARPKTALSALSTQLANPSVRWEAYAVRIATPYSRHGRVSPSIRQVEVLCAGGQQRGHAGGAAQPHGVQQRAAAAQLGPVGGRRHGYAS